jgi:hypothetical protein
LEALALFFECGEVFAGEFTLEGGMLFEGVEDAVIVVHELVMQVRCIGASGVTGMGNHLSFAHGLACTHGGGQLIQVEEEAASTSAGFEDFEGISVDAGVPIFAGDDAVEGGLHGGTGGDFEVHALVSSSVIEEGANLLPLFEGPIDEARLELCSVGEVEAGIVVSFGLEEEGLVGFAGFFAGEAEGVEEGVCVFAYFIDGPQLIAADEVLGDRNPPDECTHHDLS